MLVDARGWGKTGLGDVEEIGRVFKLDVELRKKPVLPEQSHPDMLKGFAEACVQRECNRRFVRPAVPDVRLHGPEISDLPVLRRTSEYIGIRIGNGNS